MEPRIQYAKTSDSVSIAYAVFGSGPPIVFPSGVWGDLHLSANSPLSQLLGDVNEGLASLGWRVVRYDGRGSGASDRGIADFSLEARLRDLDAVVDIGGLERFALCGLIQGGPTAIAYAARYPKRVTHLVLANTLSTSFYDVIPALRIARGMRVMSKDQWEFYVLSIASALTGFQDSESAAGLARAFRTGMDALDYVAYIDAADQIDVRDTLAQVSVPTLAVSTESLLAPGLQALPALTRQLAREIPNASFVETSDLAKVIDEFLREGGPAPDAPVPSGTAVILFADIVNSTALTERLGDTAFRAKARDLDGALRGVIREHAGTAIEGKLLGDGVLAVFTSARQAIEAALACSVAGSHAGLPLHVGLHAGDVIREEGNVYGGAVNVAARISGLSAAGEVLVSETVRSLARTSAGVGFEDRGEQALKGVGEAVRVWAVREGDW